MDTLGASDALGLDPPTSGNGNHLDDGLRGSSLNLNTPTDITDTNVMFHAPSLDLDHDMFGFYNADDPHNEIHDEIMPEHNDIVESSENGQNLSMVNEKENVSLEPTEENDVDNFEEAEHRLFEGGDVEAYESEDGTGKCEYCGVVGLQDNFYSKSKRFCKMECSKKYSALFQKKGPGTRVAISTLNRPNKRKIQRPTIKFKKVKVEAQLDTDELPSTSDDFINEVTENSNTASWIDQEFNWKEYLAQNNDKPASERLFKHIVKAPSLTEAHVGMKVEVTNDHSDLTKETDVSFWLGTVINADQNMVMLRHAGYDNDVSDFWIDIRSKLIHPIGWCYKTRRPLVPPPELKESIAEWQKFIFQQLSGARTLSSDFMDRVRKGHYNKFEIGSKVEVCDKHNLISMCVATIIDIVGDRLRLRYDGLEDESAGDYWSHFLSNDIHPVGWSQLVGHTLSPPHGWQHTLTDWNEFLAEDLHESNDALQECFVPESMGTPPSDAGSFEVGMKLEALDPRNPLCLTVASIVKTLQFNYFIVGLDSQETFFICHSTSTSIFPVGWAKQHKVFLTPPRDYAGKPFDWNKYVIKTESVVAPSHLFLHLKRRVVPFEIGTKVEAVDLREPSFICPATIVATHGCLLRVHFDGWDSTFDQWVSHETLDLFPVDWCEKNGHPLQPPGSLIPDPVLDTLRMKKASNTIARRGSSHGRVGRPPGSLNKAHTPRGPAGRGLTGKGGKGGKAGGKRGKLKLTANTGNVPFERQRFGNLREMRKGSDVQFAFNQKCACGPFLNPDEIRKLPNSISGYLNGPPHQNCIRKSLLDIVNAAIDPNQLLELFSREFYQSKKHKDLKLDNIVCLEITGKNGKRFLRRVRGPSRSGILAKYLQRICEMLQCCPYLIVEDRFPSGKCDNDCHSIFNDGSSSVPGIPQEHHTKTLLDDDNMIPEDEKDNNMDEFSIHVEQLTASNSTVTSSTTQSTAPIDSPCDPSSSSIDRGIDPLNLLDQEFLSSKDPREWSVQEVMDFMTAIGCPAHAPSFQKQEIDGKALFLLSFDELESLTENKLGPITKLKDALQSLKKMWQIPTSSS